jgi:hypothetical protein
MRPYLASNACRSYYLDVKVQDSRVVEYPL